MFVRNAFIHPSRADRFSRRALLGTVSAFALLAAGSGDGAARSLGGKSPSPSAAAIAAGQAAQLEASRAARDAQNALKRATLSIQAMQASQQAARDAARAQLNAMPNIVANGLRPGGLEVGNGLWQGADAPTETRNGDNADVTVKQTQQKAILEWKTFNVGGKTEVYFDQTAGGANAGEWIALNRVLDTTAPSKILGSIKAEGQVYVINRSGIIFGGASQVNVGTLVASSLALSNEQFMAGINNPLRIAQTGGGDRGIPTFGDHAVMDVPFTPGDAPGEVIVKEGALLQTKAGGKLMLFGPRVNNAGQLEARDGQIILAAGEQVWLNAYATQSSGGTKVVRGLDVAVSGPYPWLVSYEEMAFIPSLRDSIVAQMAERAEAVGGYSVTNSGSIYVERGNITLQSREIEQSGMVMATSALNNREGSIRLRAWSDGLMGYSSSLGLPGLFHYSAGDLTLSPGSVTTVMPDLTDTSTIEQSALATRYRPGWIDLRGKDIELGSQASVIAPAGDIVINASSDPLAPDTPTNGERHEDGSRIYIDGGAFISAGGLRDVLVAMERNFIEADLYINELRDTPLYRDSWLRGAKAIIDRRISGTFANGPMAGVEWIRDKNGNFVPGAWIGTPLADVSDWIGNGVTDLSELSTVGGSVTLKSSGSVITRQGSLIDVGGGSVRYSDGWNRTTKLLGANGQVYDIGSAIPEQGYIAFADGFTRHNERWGVTETWTNPLGKSAGKFEKGYTEGRDAGAIQIFGAEALVLEGAYWGGTVVGERQRGGSGLAKNGVLQIGDRGDPARPFSLGGIVISDDPVRLPDGFTASSQVPPDYYLAGLTPEDLPTRNTWLDASTLEQAGVAKIDLYTVAGFKLEQGTSLDLAPETTFGVTYTLTGGAGTFNIDGSIRSAGGKVVLSSPNVNLGAGARIDVSGDWVNDVLDGPALIAPTIKGGSIEIYGGLASVAPGAALDVSGGGWLSSRGGKIALKVGDAGGILLPTLTSDKLASLELSAFSAGSGGSLSFGVNGAVAVGGDAPADPGVFHLADTLYADRGFSSLLVNATGDITVAAGTTIKQTPLGVDLTSVDVTSLASGSRLADLGALRELPLWLRAAHNPTVLSLSTSADIVVGAGALIQTDIGGSVGLGGRNITVDGTIDAPAGVISIAATDTATLGQTGQLLARGTPVIYEGSAGYLTGKVLPGGSITVTSANLAMKEGSLIDASGASGTIDIPTRKGGKIALASNGGTIAFIGNGVIASTLLAKAGGKGAVGGSVSMATAPSSGPSLRDDFYQNLQWYDPTPECLLFFICSADNAIGADLTPILDSFYGPGYLAATYGYTGQLIISRAFFDAIPSGESNLIISDTATAGAVRTPDPADYGLDATAQFILALELGIDFNQLFANPPPGHSLILRPGALNDGGMANLALTGSSVQLDHANIKVSGTIDINSPLANYSSESSRLEAARINLKGHAPVSGGTGHGRLDLVAGLVDISQSSIGGFAETRLKATDVRFSPAVIPGEVQPSLSRLEVQGALTLEAGQVYPSTAVAATIKATDSITIERNGDVGPPLAAGGSLTLEAPIIEQGGVIRAPFGQITLKAATRLTLAAGSITSVSGAGLVVPYGALSNNELWLDPNDLSGQTSLSGPPEKRISLESPIVDTAQGSVVDISGGGDLYAREFVPGPGGSHDILAMPNSYAVIPGFDGVAPGGTAGDKVWLAGGNGLKAGWYMLLPATYAALPGAYLVSLASQDLTIPLTRTLAMADGSLVMGGRRGNALQNSEDQLSSTWRVMTGAQLRQYTEYNEAFANTFFASDAFKLTQYRLTGLNVVTPRLPMDGGAVVFKASQQLILDGSLQSRAGAGGRGGLVDIAGSKIAILGAGQDSTPLSADGYLILDAGQLSGFGAASLLIGGTRMGTAQGLAVTVTASDILVRNDESSALVGPEVILAATGLVDVGAGSVIAASGEVAGGAGDLVITPQQKANTIDPDGWDDGNPADDILVSPARDYGALIRVSNGDAVRVLRQGVDTTFGGVVRVGDGARLSGGKALLVDATQDTDLSGTAAISANSLSVASGRIGFGGGTTGLVLSSETLARLGQANDLTLRSYSSIDFYQSVDLGGANLTRVTLDAAGLAGYGTGTVNVRGGAIALTNSGGGTLVAGTGSGTLNIAADELVLGLGAKTLTGFSNVKLAGARRIVGEGDGSLDAGASTVELVTPVLTGRGGAAQSIVTSGALSLLGDLSQPVADRTTSLGARLALTGGAVTVAGRIVGVGGAVDLTATAGDVVLLDGALVDVGGFAKDFFDVASYADAGRIGLNASGNVRLDAGSTLDLSAAAGGGAAGSLAVRSDGGSVELAGTIDAHAAAGQRGASFTLDIDRLPNFADLSTRLNAAGFTRSRQFRVRSGDVQISGATKVESFGLSADAGLVTILGSIDARSAYGGSIAISGGAGLVMEASADLEAGATDAALGSGRVTLEAVGGDLDIRGGTIDVAGGEGGKVRFRARQTDDHAGLHVAALHATVNGATVLEGVSRYTSTTTEAVRPQALADAATFAANAGTIAHDLGLGANVRLAAGIEIMSDGDLAVDGDWNLLSDFADQREGTLTLRAAGNLLVNGNISDGFDIADRSGVLQDTASWNLRLVAGADLTAADALAVKPLPGLAGAGDIVVGSTDNGKLVRTGTGDITVRAGRDVRLASNKSVIYTAGRRDTTPLADFAEPQGAVYGIGGGHVDIAAQGSVGSALPTDEHDYQLFTEWLNRAGGENASWWVNYGTFQQGVGALGGGNVAVSASGDLVNLLVALPTNGRVHGLTTPVDQRTVDIRNGGLMSVHAGGGVLGGQYYVGRGLGEIDAGSLGAGRSVDVQLTSGPLQSFTVAPVLAVGDAVLNVRAAGNLEIQTVLEPTMVGTFRPNVGDGFTSLPAWSLYSDRTELNLSSIGGDVVLRGDPRFLFGDMDFLWTPDWVRYPDRTLSEGISGVGNRYPAVTRVTAMNGSISTGHLTTMPGNHAELALIADKDIRITGATYPFANYILMSRIVPGAIPSPLRPYQDYTMFSGPAPFDLMLEGPPPDDLNRWYQWAFSWDRSQSLPADLINPVVLPMADDMEPSRIYARSGSITGDLYTGGRITANEQLLMRAGQDVRGVGRIALRNLHKADVSLVEAGTDIIGGAYTVEGPGGITLAAGRDVYNADVVSIGNRLWDGNNRPVGTSAIRGLPEESAAITVIAGLKGKAPSYEAFMAAYLDPANVAAMPDYLKTRLPDGTDVPVYLTDLTSEQDGRPKILRRGLVSFVAEMTGETLSPLDAWTRFQALPKTLQETFVRRVYMQELREAGRNQLTLDAQNQPLNGGYNRGYAAIETLFSGNDWEGDVLSRSMTLRTMAGGDISVFAPGGGLQVAALGTTVPNGAGIVTLGGGNIDIFVDRSITVNRSRILTFVPEGTSKASSMIMWATHGDIDAGRGAKTVRVPSAPEIRNDVDGNTWSIESPDISGSGIGTVGGANDGDMYSPEGTINAGDAGIRISGDLFIGARVILNAANIDVLGDSKGVPVIEAPNIGGLTEAGNTAGASAQQASTPQQRANEQPSVIIVEVIGYGGGDGDSEKKPSSRGSEKQSLNAPGGKHGYNEKSAVQIAGYGSLSPSELRILTPDERKKLGAE